MKNETKKYESIGLILAIFIISMNLRPAITSVGPLIDTIRKQLSLSNTQVSLLTVIPVICMGIFASFAPFLNRKFGLKNTITIMLVVLGIMTALRGVFSNYAYF